MKLNKLFITLLLGFLSITIDAQTSPTIAELEQQKEKASAEENYKLAGELKLKILELKEKEKTELENAKVFEDQKRKVQEEADLKEKTALEQRKKNEEEALQKERLAEEQKKRTEVEEFKREIEESARKKKEDDAALLKDKLVAEQNQKAQEQLLLKEKLAAEQKQKTEEQTLLKEKLDSDLKIKAEQQLFEKEIALAELKIKKETEIEVKNLEGQIAKAVTAENYLLAEELKGKIKKTKEMTDIQISLIASDLKKKKEEEKTQEKLEKEQAEIQRQRLTIENEKKKENAKAIESLEKEKIKAIADANYILAEELKIKINNLKENKEVVIATAPPKPIEVKAPETELEKLEKAKAKAVADTDFKLAAELKNKINALKQNNAAENSQVDSKLSEAKASETELEKLEKEKAKAIADADFKLAGELKIKIANLKSESEKNALEAKKKAELDSQISDLEKQKAKAVAETNYALAGELNKKIKNLKEPKIVVSPVASNNNIANKQTNTSKPLQLNATYNPNPTIINSKARISSSEENATSGIKYRRSSLFTLMVNNTSREYSTVIRDAFVNSPLPEKFNNHNLSLATIDVTSNSSNMLPDIDRYFQTNRIAKELVGKWFNRNEKGLFNTKLIEQRGAYNASNIDLNIAKASARGLALISDAGEELIGNTYVVINEFRYTNKEEVANKTKSGLGIFGALVSVIPGVPDVSGIVAVADLGVTVAGKGYTIKTNSYLYQLVWNEEIAASFYKDYWIDETNYDETKKQAFDNTNLFKLKYIGLESAWADLQSNIFTSKSNEQLISKATGKAVDAGISKLQRKFEAFRTKTPIYSVNPVTAKIGLKEALEPGDKFEVLEQIQDAKGKLTYKRKGIITVDGKNIWDNRNTMEELLEAGKNTTANQYTTFKGGGDYFPGMLIRQIN